MSPMTESTQGTTYIAPLPITLSSPPPQSKSEGARSEQEKPEPAKVSMGELQKAVVDVNQNLAGMHSELNFSVDKDSGKVVLKIIDSKTKEVIRQIPQEEALRLASKISQLLGLFVDENV
jgi:flagellar protein FlaG